MMQILKDMVRRIPWAEELYYLIKIRPHRFDPSSQPLLPTSVMVELNNTCNLHCTMCGTKSARRKKGNMEIHEYRRVVDEIAGLGIRNLTLYTHGEPLLYPHLPLAIKIAKEKGLTVSISTNGNLLDEKLGRDLLQAGLDVLRYSVEGASKTSYEKIRIGGDFDCLLVNMQRFKMLRDQLRAKTAIHLNTVVMAETEPELEEFIGRYSPLVDSIHFGLLSNQGGSYKGFNSSSITRVPAGGKSPCGLLWKTFMVNWDLSATACCIDFHGELLVGDLRTQRIREIWGSEQYQYFRELHRRKMYEKMPLCGECNKNVMSKFMRFHFDREVHRRYRKSFRFSKSFGEPKDSRQVEHNLDVEKCTKIL